MIMCGDIGTSPNTLLKVIIGNIGNKSQKNDVMHHPIYVNQLGRFYIPTYYYPLVN